MLIALFRLFLVLITAVGVYFLFDLQKYSQTTLCVGGLLFGYIFDALLIRLGID